VEQVSNLLAPEQWISGVQKSLKPPTIAVSILLSGIFLQTILIRLLQQNRESDQNSKSINFVDLLDLI
jgi:hypothetical protein